MSPNAEINPRNYFLVGSFEIYKIQQQIFYLVLRSNFCFTVEMKINSKIGVRSTLIRLKSDWLTTHSTKFFASLD